jgi:hypothetical protein
MTDKLFSLANSIWPRTGGNRANSALSTVTGPTKGKIIKKISLPFDGTSINSLIRGVVVSEDGTLRTICNGSLSAITLEGELLWSVPLAPFNIIEDDFDEDEDLEDEDNQDQDNEDDLDEEDDLDDNRDFEDKHVSKIFRDHIDEDDLDDRYIYHSIPVALSNNRTLVILRNYILIFDDKGEVYCQIDIGELSPDDSGLSPNITYSDELILTSTQGAAYLFGNDHVRDLGVFGYDIRPVAMFQDNTFLITGYSELGICRVQLDGKILWDTGLKDADLVPVINSRQFSALGSFNEEFSAIYSPRGELQGRYARPAIFSEYLNGEWIAFSESHVARLQANGKVIWEQEIEAIGMLIRHQPIIDVTGNIYLLDNEFLMAFNTEGKRFLKLKVGGDTGPLSFVKEGLIAYVSGDKLILME